MENTEFNDNEYRLKLIMDDIVNTYYEMLIRQFSIEIIALSRKDILDKAIENSIKEIKELGKTFFREALQSIEVPKFMKGQFTGFAEDVEKQCTSIAEEKFRNDIYRIYAKI